MKRTLTFMAAVFTATILQLFVAVTANAQGTQGTQDDGFLLRVGGQDFKGGATDCGYYGVSGWGGDITEEWSAPVVWAYDSVGNDSLCCDTITNDYTGKIVMIRRGVCEFGRKSLWGQFAGARAVFLCNRIAGVGPCDIVNPGAGAVGSQVTIPVIFLPYQTAAYIDGLLKSSGGQPVIAQFLFPRVLEPFSAYHYATPLSQRDTLYNAGIRLINRNKDAANNVTVKADVIAPDGSVASLSVPISTLSAGQDTFVEFPPFLPKGILGKFKVNFSTSLFTETRDTVSSEFEYTPYTFATDNLVLDPGGIGTSNADFLAANFFYQTAGWCLTGPNGGVGTHVTFGIANIDSVYVGGDPAANAVNCILYDLDANGDGSFDDLQNGFEDLTDGIVGVATYNFNGSEVNDSLFSVKLEPLNGDKIDLKPNHIYYISLLYDGTLAGTGRCPRFTDSPKQNYDPFLATPLQIGSDLYTGWDCCTHMTRLQLEGFDPTSTKPTPLAVNKFSVTPNPAYDQLRVQLDLATVNKGVAVSLLDYKGSLVHTEIGRNFQSGQFTFDTRQVPAGLYLVWIRTAEGATTQKVVISH